MAEVEEQAYEKFAMALLTGGAASAIGKTAGGFNTLIAAACNL